TFSYINKTYIYKIIPAKFAFLQSLVMVKNKPQVKSHVKLYISSETKGWGCDLGCHVGCHLYAQVTPRVIPVFIGVSGVLGCDVGTFMKIISVH
ncbi:MAG: hypothetical protein Q4F85_02605, partial [Prevotella sp.]|nr:hypothetical protein [Prevotella sp.]